MRQCPSRALFLTALPYAYLDFTGMVAPPPDPWLRCELSDLHPGRHADHVPVDGWEQSEDQAWARWTTGGPVQLVGWFWCKKPDPDASDFCTLFLQHPGGHAWEVTDPGAERALREFREEWRSFASFLDSYKPDGAV